VAARPRRLTPTRRGLLAASAVSGLLAGCGGAPSGTTPRRPPPGGSARVRYGEEHGLQFAELRLPTKDPLATVVLLHGGYWLPGYGLELMNPLSFELTDLGFATWNVEYRRTAEGGGFPTTLSDVAAAVDRLDGKGLPGGLAGNVVLLGHSAGGHLAVWAASRTDRTPGGEPKVEPRGAISLAGVLDLVRAGSASGSTDPVTAFMGGSPTQTPESYALADPALLVPAGCPVGAVDAEDDETVPPEQSTSYVALAESAGATVERVVVPGDHLSLIDPRAESFPTIRKLVTEAASRQPL
jgi:acetyl esterase/lipase